MKAIKIIGVILALLLVVFAGLDWFINSNYVENQSFISASDKVDKIVIKNRSLNSHEAYLIEKKDDINKLKKAFARVSEHMWDAMDSVYHVDFFNDFFVESAPYPAGITQAQEEAVKPFFADKFKKCYYSFYVKNQVNLAGLVDKLKADGNVVCVPYGSVELTKPYIDVYYQQTGVTEAQSDAARKDYPLGKFKADEKLVPFIDEVKKLGVFFGNSDVRFSSGSSSDYERRITIYLNRSLTNDEVKQLENFAKTNGLVHYGKPFIYQERLDCQLNVLFDSEQSAEQLRAFCNKYDVSNYDYDKKPMDFDEITIYNAKWAHETDNSKTINYRSVTINKDLSVVVKQYDNSDFVPFKDKEPSYKIIRQYKISQVDFDKIKQLLGNYNVANIPDTLGIGGYHFDHFIYIGVKTGDKQIVCGGEDDYSENHDFSGIYSGLQGILGKDDLFVWAN